MSKAKKDAFKVKRGYGLIFCKERKTLRWFKDTPGVQTHWPAVKNPDNQINIPYVQDLNSLRLFMLNLALMFSKESLHLDELNSSEHYIVLIYC